MTEPDRGSTLTRVKANIVIADQREMRRAHLAAAASEIIMLTLPGLAATRLEELPPGDGRAQFTVDDIHCEGFVEHRVFEGWYSCVLYVRLGGDDLPFDSLYVRLGCTWQDSGAITYTPGNQFAYGKDDPSLDELRAVLEPPPQA